MTDDSLILNNLQSLRMAVAEGRSGLTLTLSDIDYLIGLFENGFQALSVSDDHEMRAWELVVENRLDDVFRFFAERGVGFARWSADHSPLMLACLNRNSEYVKTMLAMGWSPNEWTDVYHETPLTCAASVGADDIFFMLIDAGAKLELVGHDCELTTAPEGEEFLIDAGVILGHAIKGGSVVICRFLVDKIGDMSSWGGDWYPDVIESFACRRFCAHSGIPSLAERVEEVWRHRQERREELFYKGVFKEDDARRELYRICAEGTEEELFAFYRNGAVVNPNFPHFRKEPISAFDESSDYVDFWSYPIHEAARRMGIDAVRFLVEKGADPKCGDFWHSEPLFYAVEGGNLDVVKYLVEECDNLPAEANMDGVSPLGHAKEGSAVKEWLGTVTWRINTLAKHLLGRGTPGRRLYRLWRDEDNESDRRYIYSLQLFGIWQDMEKTAKDARRRIAESLLPTERLECSGSTMCVVGKGYSITYCVEGCGKHATHAVRFDEDAVSVVPLGRMGIYQCCNLMARRGISLESVGEHMMEHDFVTYFPNCADRFVAIYRWLTGRLVFKSDATRAAELISRGEGDSVEFKSASGGVHDDVFETICSFANGAGGDIMLGVNDHGQIIGVPREILDDVKSKIKRMCAANGAFSKPIRVGVQELIVNRRRIVHIQVPRMKHWILYKGDCFVRRGSSDFRDSSPALTSS